MSAAESGVEPECGARAKTTAGLRVEDVGGRDLLAAHLGHHILWASRHRGRNIGTSIPCKSTVSGDHVDSVSEKVEDL